MEIRLKVFFIVCNENAYYILLNDPLHIYKIFSDSSNIIIKQYIINEETILHKRHSV